ncbi:pseudouridylate synthase RPUSD4, mitochondrial [Engraulis encrasicolus]|uniref:pseudouridylate synthase RPUSD4, mitochondrial n=1 Tax=Engraulis encrasicolus TaxID=184585 RepID=UPI002FCF80A0
MKSYTAMQKGRLFLKSGVCSLCPDVLITWQLCQERSVAASQFQVIRSLVSAPGQPQTGEQRASENKRGLRAIDLARRQRESKEEASGPRGKTLKKANLKEAQPVSPLQRRVAELKQYSQQLQNVHPNVLAKTLHKSIVFKNQDLVAINKPYGVPVHDTADGSTSIASILPVLAQMLHGMRTERQLHICHKLDKSTTGVLLLGQSEEATEHIQSLFKALQVERKYWAVSEGIPVPSEGVVDIPVIEREVTGPKPHFKMGLSPLFRPSDGGEGVSRVRANRHAHSAVTQYRVLDSSYGCSLVELHPVTDVKDQVRVHMALALGCPILGDHKYAHWEKLAPQQLPKGVLRHLGLEQSKVRHLPLHLHHHHLTLPSFRGHGDITLFCRLPKFFTSSVQKLHLSLPEKTGNEVTGT